MPGAKIRIVGSVHLEHVPDTRRRERHYRQSTGTKATLTGTKKFPLLIDSAKELEQVARRELRRGVGAVEHARDERTLGAVQREDLLLDGAARDEPVDRDRLVLADAVRAIGGLIFDGGVPPRIEVDHVVGAGEVDAGAAGLERDQEQIALAGLEPA